MWLSNQSGSPTQLLLEAQLIFVTTVTIGGGVLFSNENAKFLPILASFGNFVPNLCTVWRNFYRPKKCGGVPKLTNIRYEDCQRSSKNTYILQIIYFCLEILIPAGWNTEQDNLEKRANSVCQGISNTFLYVVLYGVAPIILI